MKHKSFCLSIHIYQALREIWVKSEAWRKGSDFYLLCIAKIHCILNYLKYNGIFLFQNEVLFYMQKFWIQSTLYCENRQIWLFRAFWTTLYFIKKMSWKCKKYYFKQRTIAFFNTATSTNKMINIFYFYFVYEVYSRYLNIQKAYWMQLSLSYKFLLKILQSRFFWQIELWKKWVLICLSY